VKGRPTAPESNSSNLNDSALIEYAGRIPIDQIPGVILFLTARWLSEKTSSSSTENNWIVEGEAEKLLTAGELALHLNVPESWV
jgi:hypothetical protein